MYYNALQELLPIAIKEDIATGDVTALACIPKDKTGKAQLIQKQPGVIAGLHYIAPIFEAFDPNIQVSLFAQNGDYHAEKKVLAEISGNSQALLSGERLMLNLLQRMSGIATKTRKLSLLIADYKTRLLDTRKTAPGLRVFDKEAVAIGGGVNHRMGLYDMVMIKDNHIDHAGGIAKAITNCENYLQQHQLDIEIEVEARSMEEVKEIMQFPSVSRILLDNFTPKATEEAVALIAGKKITESSGGITETTLVDYAKAGVDFISVGALTHSVRALDLSLKEVS